MIEVTNLTRAKIDFKWVEEIIQTVLTGEKKQAGLSVAFVGLRRMKLLNEKYRKKQGPTDVLSFENNLSFDDSLGELIVCPEQVKKNNPDDFEGELKRVIIHGTLHLLGFDHGGEMRGKEERYFSF